MQASVLHGSILIKRTHAPMQAAVLHGSLFRKSSENFDDMPLGCARVPKIIPMQGSRALGGPFPDCLGILSLAVVDRIMKDGEHMLMAD